MFDYLRKNFIHHYHHDDVVRQGCVTKDKTCGTYNMMRISEKSQSKKVRIIAVHFFF
jgi:hypothetical protein